jgi:hypothetical protein
MKKLKFCMIFFSLLLIPLVAHSETFTTLITDSGAGAYWGGQVVHAGATAYGDVIGNPYFSATQMLVEQTGDLWTVTLSGPYFDYRRSQTADGGLPFNLDPGDLYISSTGWYATQNDQYYSTDTFNANENWDYVVPITPTGTASGLYALNFAGITTTNVDPYDANNYIYRSNQAWQGGATGSSLGTAGYAFSDFASGNTLTFTFDASNLNITDAVGFHWTMQCGNDVLEGQVTSQAPPEVPEPSTLLLLGLGLTGIVTYKKIRS